jgi:uncharacterized delta-60 repeat protein
MRIQTALLVLMLTPIVARAADADLDRTFGSHGWTPLDPSTHRDGGEKVALQSDGKIVLAGWSNASGGGNWLVARFTSSGALDPSFGTGGVISPVTSNGYAGAAAVQPDGKILVCGGQYGTGSPTSAVARYESDGTLDASFGIGGIATIDVAPGATVYEQPTALVVQPDGGVVVVGYYYDNALGTLDFSIELFRLLPDGSPDPSFGTGGVASLPFAEPVWSNAVALQPDGKIVVGGFIEDPDKKFLVMRLDADGAFDPTFGTGGIVVDSPDGPIGSQLVLGVDVLPDGKILAGGYGNGAAIVMRYLPDGSADGAFGMAGVAKAAFPGEYITVNHMARRGDGSIVLVGSVTRSLDLTMEDMAVVRFDADGVPDTSFAPNGVARIVIGAETSLATGAVAQPDGRIVVTGRRNELGGYTPATHDVRILVARIGNTCGEGGVDAGEECDDGNDVDGDCCSVACRFETSGSTCGTPDANPCTFDACDGAGTCVMNQMSPAGFGCGDPSDICTFDACDGAGTCLTDQLAPAGTPCGDADGSPCTLDACDGAGTCVVDQPRPASACLAPTLPLRSSLVVVDKADPRRDKLTWKWTRGPEVSDFGHPDTTTGYRLCLFSGSTLVADDVLPTGVGWTSSSKGWKLARSQAGVGIAKAKLLYGDDGRSRITLQGRGPLLDMPALPLVTPVTAHLISTTGACFRATYASPSANIASKFRAKGS